MKKIFLILLVFLITSCSLVFYSDDGFTLFRYVSFIYDGRVCVQSHDGYIANDKIYNESVFDLPITIYNQLSHDIDVKVTTVEKTEWVNIPSSSILTIQELIL